MLYNVAMRTFAIIYFYLLLSWQPSAADNWYAFAGLSVHDKAMSAPEVNLDTLLFEAEVGREWKIDQSWSAQIFIHHLSGVYTTEKGDGLNPAGFRLIFKWQ